MTEASSVTEVSQQLESETVLAARRGVKVRPKRSEVHFYKEGKPGTVKV